MTFKLYKQKPNPPRKPLIGYLSVDQNFEAMFFNENHTLLETMERVQIDYASTQGMRLTGFEQRGYQKNGSPKFIYQEWYLVFNEEIK